MATADVLLCRWNGGWRERVGTLYSFPSSAGFVGRRVEGLVSVGALTSPAEVDRVADAQLAKFHAPRKQVDVGAWPQAVADDAYTGYEPGDTVNVPVDVFGDLAPWRTVSITVTEDQVTGVALATPALVPPPGSPGPELIISEGDSVAGAAKKMANGTLRGHSKVAQPHVVPFNRRVFKRPKALDYQVPPGIILTGWGPFITDNGNEFDTPPLPAGIPYDFGDGRGPVLVPPRIIRVIAGGASTGNTVGESLVVPGPCPGCFNYYTVTPATTFIADPGWSPGGVIIAEFTVGDWVQIGDVFKGFTWVDAFPSPGHGGGIYPGLAAGQLSGVGGGSAIITRNMPPNYTGPGPSSCSFPFTPIPACAVLNGGNETDNLVVVGGGAGGYGADEAAPGIISRATAYPLGGAGGILDGDAGTTNGSGIPGGGGSSGAGGSATSSALPGGYFISGDAGSDGVVPPAGHNAGNAGGGGAGRYGGGGGSSDAQYGAAGGGGGSWLNPAGTLVSASHVMAPEEAAYLVRGDIFHNRGPNFSYAHLYALT